MNDVDRGVVQATGGSYLSFIVQFVDIMIPRPLDILYSDE